VTPLAAAAAGLAVLAPAAAGQDVDAVVEAAIPHDSAISEQYHEAADVVAEAVPATPPTPPAPPPAEEYQAPEEQYHSEPPADVTVTQTQPSNVNVSIRINSPGDDGPVVQINNAGGGAVAGQQPPPAKPKPAPGTSAPSGGGSDAPKDWEWVWTSACFGDARQAAAAAAAAPGWRWEWSCDEDQKAGGRGGREGPADVVEGIVDGGGGELAGAIEDPARLADELAGAIGDVAPERALGAGGPRAGHGSRAGRRLHDRGTGSTRSSGQALAGRGDSLLTAAGSAAVIAPRATVTARHPAALAEHAVRRAARATARDIGDGAQLLFPLGAGGLAAGPASGLGPAATLLLGGWLAVLISALLLVIPRFRNRRWSGPTRRAPRPRSSRLERPG
jgi:hypothetical protein